MNWYLNIEILHKTVKKIYAWVLCGLIVFLIDFPVRSQGLIRTMREQLARLEINYLEIKQGYEIVQGGLRLIGDIKQEDFDQHLDHFTSLWKVKPSLRSIGRIDETSELCDRTIRLCNTMVASQDLGPLCTPERLSYLARVCDRVIQLSKLDAGELVSIATDDRWQMNDEERLSRIEKLYRSSQERYQFIRRFGSAEKEAGLWRQRQAADYQSLLNLY